MPIFVVGGKRIEAPDVQHALFKAGAAHESAENLIGVKKAISVSELTPEGKDYWKTLFLMLKAGSQETFRSQSMRHFNAVDSDRDGKITKREVRNLIIHIAHKLKLPQVASDENLASDLFNRYDADNNGYIDFEEFQHLYRRMLRRVIASFHVSDAQDLRQRKSAQEFRNKYELGKRIAAGAQGVTYLATEKSTGKQYVVKKPNATDDTEDFDQLVEKVHPHVVRVFELFSSPFETFIVMEFCAGGDLFGVMKHCHEHFGAISRHFCADGTRQILLGVQYLHSEFKDCHNDIKPENVLAERKPNDKNDVPRLMVADFGCASGLGENCNGDPRYNAPELWRGGRVDYKTDVWACGAMLYEMLSGGMLIFTDAPNISGWVAWQSYGGGVLLQRLQQRILVPGAQPDWSRIAPAGQHAVQMCQSMLAWDPNHRASVSQALESSFLSDDANTETDLPFEIHEALAQRGNHSVLKMMLLNMVASKLQGESLDHYQALWDVADKDKSGVLDKDEFIQMLTEHGMKLETARDLHSMADLSQDGRIDFNEFVAVMFNADGLDHNEMHTELYSIFRGIAGDDNKINYEDFANAFPEGGFHKAEIEHLFQKIDKDGKGYIDANEFEAFVSAL